MILRARHFATGRAVDVAVEGERVQSIQDAPEQDSLPFIAPGLFDLQVNGRDGVWFSDETLTCEQTLQILQSYAVHGITRICPTLITNSADALEHGFSVIRQACEQDRLANWIVAGCHLEGPYLSSDDGPRGAHAREFVRGCDWTEFERWQRASGGRIRLVTLAPEAPDAVEFIRRAVDSGVVISIGHTAATTAQIEAAVDAGARLSTHLGNAAHAQLPRHPNYIWDQLGEPRLSASIISDGHHLPASVVRSISFAKGPKKTILTCDASGLAGCPPGEYQYQGRAFEVVDDGRIVVAGQRQFLAGSGLHTDACVARMITMTGCTLEQAWNMASRNPARLLNIEAGELQVGAIADLVIFELDTAPGALCIHETYIRGERRFVR